MESVSAQGDLIILPERGLFAGGYPNEIKLVELPLPLPQPEIVAAYQHSWRTYQEFGGPEPVALALKLEYGSLRIRPEVGMVSLIIRLEEQYDTVVAEVNALPATIFIGQFSNRQDTIPLTTLKHQRGLRAEVLNLNINLRCRMIAFEMIIAGKQGKQNFQVTGSRFTEEIIEKLQMAQPGDLIVFRSIRYECPGAEEFQRAADMVFEVK